VNCLSSDHIISGVGRKEGRGLEGWRSRLVSAGAILQPPSPNGSHGWAARITCMIAAALLYIAVFCDPSPSCHALRGAVAGRRAGPRRRIGVSLYPACTCLLPCLAGMFWAWRQHRHVRGYPAVWRGVSAPRKNHSSVPVLPSQKKTFCLPLSDIVNRARSYAGHLRAVEPSAIPSVVTLFRCISVPDRLSRYRRRASRVPAVPRGGIADGTGGAI